MNGVGFTYNKQVDLSDGRTCEMTVVDTWDGPVTILMDYFVELWDDARDPDWMLEVATAVVLLLDNVPGPIPAVSGTSREKEEAEHLEQFFDWILAKHPRFSPVVWEGERGSQALIDAAYRFKAKRHTGVSARMA